MPLITLKTIIDADIKTCFDLSRNIDFHTESLKHSKEKAIAGKTSGLIELGETVTWEAFHFGVKQQLTSKITQFNSPNYFVDEMVSGVFKSFKHEHIFSVQNNKTIMVDKFYFKSPFGVLGKIANVLFLKKYMSNLLNTRNKSLKIKAEILEK
ncbi:cell division protein [Olleya aquimaris]|uniref:SRPBCC family protein n=1 Tax=Olleya sediminilitoris TaxID=2795739 RepID=A0ABS1WME9_9FLAO|nr:SRPBCC family protein [Olleya sediminilitoris]AXO79136.1 cell division protein [Olleya aquimaris]MBL7560280.1 SRPBCC family protein [Olleya sediminilitoris]